MRIEKANNSPNFKMAWHKDAKNALTFAVAKLPKRLQGKAIDVINELEHNSPHHTLSFSVTNGDMKFSASQNVSAAEYFSFTTSKFINGLMQLKKSILKQNIDVPLIEQSAKKLELSLRPYASCGIFDSGLRIPEMELSHFASNFARHLTLKRKSPKVADVLTILSRIDEKAKLAGVTVRLTAYKGFSIVKKTSKIEIYRTNTDNVTSLKKIDKKLDKIIKNVKNENAKDDKVFEKDMKSIKKYERRQKFFALIRASKVYKFIVVLKSKVAEQFQKYKQARVQKLEAVQSKIAERLDI